MARTTRSISLCLAAGLLLPGCLAEDRPPRPDPKTAFCTRLQERGDAAFTKKDLDFLDKEADRAQRRDPSLAARLRKIAARGRLEADVVVYLQKGVTAKRRKRLEKELDKLEELGPYVYVSSPEALSRFKDQNRDNPELWETLGPRTLPPYYTVDIGAEPSDEVAEVAEAFPFVEEVRTADKLRADALVKLGNLCDL